MCFLFFSDVSKGVREVNCTPPANELCAFPGASWCKLVASLLLNIETMIGKTHIKKVFF